MSQVHVGERIRQLRMGLGISVRTLAAKAGFSPSLISQVEHGQVSPSIASLERIATALGISLGRFFTEFDSSPAAVVRGTVRQQLTSSWSQATIEALGPMGGAGRLEPVMITMAPGGRSGKHPTAHPGEEFAIVFEGEVTLTLRDEVHVLQKGDAVTFASETPHLWENTSAALSRVIIVAARFLH
jgi:transcriptional regulator with XRE-family HTH domain